MTDLFAHARNTDPATSHRAARKIDVTKGESRVLDALHDYGPQTMEELADLTGTSINTVGPRFRPLMEKRRIAELRGGGGEVVTRAGRSGAERTVYCIQSDASLWRDRPSHSSKDQKRIIALEESLREIRNIAAISEGGDFYVMLVDKVLEN